MGHGDLRCFGRHRARKSHIWRLGRRPPAQNICHCTANYSGSASDGVAAPGGCVNPAELRPAKTAPLTDQSVDFVSNRDNSPVGNLVEFKEKVLGPWFTAWGVAWRYYFCSQVHQFVLNNKLRSHVKR